MISGQHAVIDAKLHALSDALHELVLRFERGDERSSRLANEVAEPLLEVTISLRRCSHLICRRGSDGASSNAQKVILDLLDNFETLVALLSSIHSATDLWWLHNCIHYLLEETTNEPAPFCLTISPFKEAEIGKRHNPAYSYYTAPQDIIENIDTLVTDTAPNATPYINTAELQQLHQCLDALCDSKQKFHSNLLIQQLPWQTTYLPHFASISIHELGHHVVGSANERVQALIGAFREWWQKFDTPHLSSKLGWSIRQFEEMYCDGFAVFTLGPVALLTFLDRNSFTPRNSIAPEPLIPISRLGFSLDAYCPRIGYPPPVLRLRFMLACCNKESIKTLLTFLNLQEPRLEALQDWSYEQLVAAIRSAVNIVDCERMHPVHTCFSNQGLDTSECVSIHSQLLNCLSDLESKVRDELSDQFELRQFNADGVILIPSVLDEMTARLVKGEDGHSIGAYCLAEAEMDRFAHMFTVAYRQYLDFARGLCDYDENDRRIGVIQKSFEFLGQQRRNMIGTIPNPTSV